MKLGEALVEIGRPVAYYPRLAEALGGVKAAIFAAQLIYWWDRQDRGYVYKTSAEVREETGLSYKEQKAARSRLQKLGILEERYDRLNHRMLYAIDINQLNRAWNEYIETGAMTQKAIPESTKG